MSKITKQQIIKINEECQNNFKLDLQCLMMNEEKILIKNIDIDEVFNIECKIEHTKNENNLYNICLKLSKHKKISDKMTQLVSSYYTFILDNKEYKRRNIKDLIKYTELLNDEELQKYINKCDVLTNNDVISIFNLIQEVNQQEQEQQEQEQQEEEVKEEEVNPIIESIRLTNLINQFENTEIIKVLQEFCKTKNLIIKDNKNYTMIYKKEKNKKRDKMLSEIQFKKKSIRFFINERHLTEEITNLSDTEKSSIGEYSFEFTHDIFDNINQSKILEIILNNFISIFIFTNSTIFQTSFLHCIFYFLIVM